MTISEDKFWDILHLLFTLKIHAERHWKTEKYYTKNIESKFWRPVKEKKIWNMYTSGQQPYIVISTADDQVEA